MQMHAVQHVAYDYLDSGILSQITARDDGSLESAHRAGRGREAIFFESHLLQNAHEQIR